MNIINMLVKTACAFPKPKVSQYLKCKPNWPVAGQTSIHTIYATNKLTEHFYYHFNKIAIKVKVRLLVD